MPATLQAHKEKHKLGWEIAKYAISAVILGLGIAVMAFLFSIRKAPQTRQSTALIQQVGIQPVEAYAGSLFLEVSGTVVPFREVRVASEVVGQIIKQFPIYENGMFVKRGEPLLQIDPEAYELEIRTLESEVVQAEKRILENLLQIEGEEKNIELAEADLELQIKDFERYQRLGGALTPSELEQAQRAVNAARTQLQTRKNSLVLLKASEPRLEAALELAKRQLDRAKLNLRRTTIYAPADGVIVRTLLKEGDFVNAGTQVAIFEDISQAEVVTNLTPSELRWIRDNSSPDAEMIDNGFLAVYRIPKTAVTIFDPMDPLVSWQGVLSRFDGIGRDDLTKTIPVRINVAEPIVENETGHHALVRGMFVRCRMEVQVSAGQRALFRVPEVAVHPNGAIWVVRDNQLAQIKIRVVNRREVEDRGEMQKIAIIKVLEGELRAGDTVVVTPLSSPYTGMPVLLEGQESEVF